jgi:hypothetical protein
VAESLTLTQYGIPVSLRAFFQEYRLEDLDPDHDAATIWRLFLHLDDQE